MFSIFITYCFYNIFTFKGDSKDFYQTSADIKSINDASPYHNERYLSLSTDKQYYQPNEHIFIRGIISSAITNSMTDIMYGRVNLKITHNDNEISSIQVNLINNTISFVYHIPSIYQYIL